jgi:hypothetical protein
MTRNRFHNSLCFLGMLLIGSGRLGFGQTATATISGRIPDSGGAAIVGATVEVVSVERGTLRSVPTNSTGIGVLPSVEPGHYDITMKQTGFKQGEEHPWGGRCDGAELGAAACRLGPSR